MAAQSSEAREGTVTEVRSEPRTEPRKCGESQTQSES